MLSIASIVPNHSQRLENIQVAEDVIHKRKQELSPSRRALKVFEMSLKQQQGKLKTTSHLDTIEMQQENKLKTFYMDEKVKRQQELEKELQIREELKRKKKHKELEVIKAKFQEEKDQLKREGERQKKELKRVQLEKERLEKQTEEERKKLEDLKKQQEEQKRITEAKRQEELRRIREEEEKRRRLEEKRILDFEREKAEERRRKVKEEEEEKKKRLTEARILETEREKAEGRRKKEKERLKEVEEQLRKEVERDKMEEKRKHEEQQILLDDLLSNSPDVKARRKDFLWKQIQERAQIEMEEEKHKVEKTNQLRSQQSIMDSVTLGATSTPTIYRKPSNEYQNDGHRSNPSLPQTTSGFNSDFILKRFHHLDSFDSSYPSDPLHRKLSIEPKPEPSYDTLEKLFKSEENVTQQNQNHYDLPWHSKKLPFGSVQPRRGTLENGNSPGHHKRNKSEGVMADPSFKSTLNRENLTPSPAGGYHHTYVHTSHTPPPRNPSLTSSNSANKIRSPPVYEDIPTPSSSTTRGSPSSSNEMTVDSLLLSLKGNSVSSLKSSENGFQSSYPLANGLPPTYSQVIRSNRKNTTSPPAAPSPPIAPSPHRNRSHTVNGRIAHQYPLTSTSRTGNSSKNTKPPSVSYV